MEPTPADKAVARFVVACMVAPPVAVSVYFWASIAAVLLWPDRVLTVTLVAGVVSAVGFMVMAWVAWRLAGQMLAWKEIRR